MSAPTTPSLILDIIHTAKAQGLTQAALAERAGIASETLSRLKTADDVRLSSLTQLASVVGLRLTLVADHRIAEDISRGDLF